MQQIMNITHARNNLSEVVSSVARDKKNVVIIRDSKPEAVLVPYQEFVKTETDKERLWKLEFEKLQREGKKAFRAWARKKGIDVDKLTEEEVYDLIDKI